MIEKLGSLVELVESIVDELEAAAIPYALGGAIAYSAWGEPRATRDIDLNVWLDIERFEPAFAALERCGVTIDRERAVAEARERGMFVARARDYRIDVFVPSVEFYDEALRQRRRVRLAGRDTWVLAPESLTVFKMLFFRPKDLADVGRILEIQKSAFDRAYVRRWLVDMLGEDDERIRSWDEVVRRHAPVRS